MLRLTNTLTGKKEEIFTRNNTVSLYVCGITPYSDSHVGHGRCYVFFDLLYRFLDFLRYEVTYCRNITDIDDKLLHAAQKKYADQFRYHDIADHYIDRFNADMLALNCKKPTHEPRVTSHISDIIIFIKQLIDAGYAYQAGQDVYFSINAFPHYGKLSKQKIEDLRTGVRVDVREDKRDPLDFALWKGEPAEQFWNSPWGYGRPGWHIECSALASLFLGKHLSIHGGGLDLIFPHHENEIAQSESLFGAPFAHMWLHNGLVTSQKEKMSKSLGNILSLEVLFETYNPMVVRYYYLTHHYRAPIDFSYQGLDSAQKGYERLCRAFSDTKLSDVTAQKPSALADHIQDFLCDDLNTPGMFGIIFENLHEIEKNSNDRNAVGYILKNVLGITLTPPVKTVVEITPEIQKIINERETARQEKQWSRADQLREQLEQMGVDVHDKKIQ